MTHPPCGRPVLFPGVAVAVVALFLGLAAGPASAGPEVGVRAPSGQSSDQGPRPSKGGEAKRKTGEGAKPGSAARPGKVSAKTPHAARGSAGHSGGQAGKPKGHSASRLEGADSEEDSPAGRPHPDEPNATPATTTTTPLRNPDRDIRALSNGAAGIATSLTSIPTDPSGLAGTAPAGAEVDVPPPPDAVIDGALGPPLLGAGPAPSRWVPFVPTLDEPAFPALLLAALAVFLALFGRGDRRDPKLVEAVVDDRTEDVDFS